MALTVDQQLTILTGGLNPSGFDIERTVEQTAFQFSVVFLNGYKQFATEDAEGNPINQEASSYVGKMKNILSLLFRRDQRLLVQMPKVLVGILGASEVTFAQVQGSTGQQWLDFLAGNIRVSLEFLAGVSIEERNEYNALP